MRTYLVDWYGPFSDEEVATRSLRKVLDWPELAENGLYIIIGKQKYQKKCRVQYVGISKNTFSQRFANHHVKSIVEREVSIWIGKIDAQDEALRSELELVEHVLLHFSGDTQLNNRKINSKPSRSCLVVSRFWDKEGTSLDMPDQCFEAIPAVLVWDKDAETLHYAERLNILSQGE